MMALKMDIIEIGDTYELSRENWRGHKAKISKDPDLLEAVKKYTWTYSESNNHPYLKSSKLGISLHRFVMNYIYGDEKISKMIAEGCIIEHLDNDGLNCTYENLHILSGDMNLAKAFSIDKRQKEGEDVLFPAYIMDVYYIHNTNKFQMQIFMNEDIYYNSVTNNAAEMFICMYEDFDNLYLDWFYLLKCRSERIFDKSKLHASEIRATERPVFQVTEEERNSPFIEREGVIYLNLDAQNNGIPLTSVNHTALRKNEKE